METRKDLIFTRSNRNIKKKYVEAMKILEYSVMMVELFEVKEFSNIIAGQLRLILCDTSKRRIGRKMVIIDNSLIKKINPNPKLFSMKEPVELNEKACSFIPDRLFDYKSSSMIDIKLWLKQVIMKVNISDKLQELTIFDFIKESANKSGGAHVDNSLHEKAFIIEVHAERVLCDIAKVLFRSTGRNFDQRTMENSSYLISKFSKKTEG